MALIPSENLKSTISSLSIYVVIVYLVILSGNNTFLISLINITNCFRPLVDVH